MIRRPPISSPLSTYGFSASGAWTSTASASPRFAISRAAPVPTAMGFTSMQVSCRNIGSRESSRPVSWVLVVVARMISPQGLRAGDGCRQAEGGENGKTMDGQAADMRTSSGTIRGNDPT